MKKNVLIKQNASIKEAMRSIDHSGLRAVYVVDNENRLLGVVSDSEIRKSIIKGKDIKSPVKDIVKENPVVLHEKDLNDPVIIRKTVQKLRSRMPDARQILVLNSQGKPRQLAFIYRLLSQKKNKHDTEHSGKNILVVGGAGYLGSVLVRKLLAKGYRVRVLDVLMFGRKPLEELLGNKRFELIEGDMRDISVLVRSLEGIDAVINLAAVVGDPACKSTPERTIETNYLANKALAEACKYNQINRFIYASTCSVYGVMTGDKHLDENSALNPVSLYARSKIQSEEGILSLVDENFSPTILRMGTLYGYSPRMRFDLVVNAMTKTAVLEKKIIVHNGGKQWRPLLEINDAAEAYIECLEAPVSRIKGAIFNVGSDEQNYQIIQMGQAVKRCVPDAELIIQEGSDDARNYLVSFGLIKKHLRYKAMNSLYDAVMRIKQAIIDKEIDKLDDKIYYNVEYNK
ncbi:MAG: NAD-dependent epimerase/dehydratase family protein [Candidatus Omnitrophica bacterium]|nr:NAD-dependent epimerase/dehydratase family protein [Candidatus Omnitrophota bacterium]